MLKPFLIVPVLALLAGLFAAIRAACGRPPGCFSDPVEDSARIHRQSEPG